MRAFISFLILGLIASTISFADNLDKAVGSFKQANIDYKNSSYMLAIENYENVLGLGYENGNLYYNLGNAYFKTGNLGKALLNYEKAKRFIPADRDLEANYSYASSLVKSNGSSPASSWLFIRFFDRLSLDQSTLLLSALYILILAAVGFLVVLRLKRKFIYVFISFCLIVFIGCIFSLHKRLARIGKEAIVLSKSIDARFEPNPESQRYFTLYEGSKVFVVESLGQWSKVMRSDKKIGWIENNTIEKF